jgi:hypothetical protein
MELQNLLYILLVVELLVVFPVYNKESLFLTTLKKCNLSTQKFKHIENIVVSDRSIYDANQLLNDNSNLYSELLYHGKNQGKSDTVKRILRVRQGESVLILDIDPEYDTIGIVRL